MSKPEGSGKSVELEAFERLESAIARLVRSVEESDRRAVSAESQVQEVKTQMFSASKVGALGSYSRAVLGPCRKAAWGTPSFII